MIAQEIWKPIPGYPGYEVSDIGRVKSLKRRSPYILQPFVNPKTNYLSVNLSVNGKTKNRRIHQLVMLAFVGSRPNRTEVCHNDGNGQNNRLDNLRYDTHTGNMRDAIIQDSYPGLTSQEREQIKQDRLNGNLIETLSQKYRVHKNTILRASKKAGFRPREFNNKRAKIIREEFAKGDTTLTELAKRHSVDLSTVSLIVNGKRCPKAGGPIKGINY